MNALAYVSISLLVAFVPAAPCQEAVDTEKIAILPPENHPRPSFARCTWTALDGTWNYVSAPASEEKPATWSSKISVPSIIGSPASNIDQKPTPTEKAWFQRSFKCPKPKPTHRIHLHFAGVGGQSEVWVNDTLAMTHKGDLGQFHLDITDLLTEGENAEQKLTISTLNRADEPSLGIIRSTWLEEVPRTHLSNLQIKTDNDNGTVNALAGIWGQANFHKLEFVVNDGPKQVASSTSQYDYKKGGYAADITVPNFQKWNPKNPKLYRLRLRLLNEDGSVSDEVFSHFAFRDVSNLSILSDVTISPGTASSSSPPIIALNGKISALLGVEKTTSSSGQGDEKIRAEIVRIQKAGFNLVRISNTFENPRFYHLADQLGLLIWQDLPTPAKDPASKAQLLERSRAISPYLNHPSIIIWPEAFASAVDLPYTAGQKAGSLRIRTNLAAAEGKDQEHAYAVIGITPTPETLAKARELLGKDLSVAVFKNLPEEE